MDFCDNLSLHPENFKNTNWINFIFKFIFSISAYYFSKQKYFKINTKRNNLTMINLNGVCIFTQRGNFMKLPSLLYKWKPQMGQHVITDLYLLLCIIRNIAAFRKITCFHKKPSHSLWFLKLCGPIPRNWSFRMPHLYNWILSVMLLSNQLSSYSPNPFIAIIATEFFLH